MNNPRACGADLGRGFAASPEPRSVGARAPEMRHGRIKRGYAAAIPTTHCGV